ncbi:DUF3566 domain-containing protein [Arcanobacterium hippocoleae]|uniref:Flagellar biosynthesis protein FlhB n=1 Tax=Arcanobacterium hippocoleae TaxID=149017 RepID=A0ABU1T2L2_9ACTO|nr:DUF3566 domain-containing protein [Arcanobacterium hippocoleae]MDR6939568.1 flagellar biosynthesis protein FlhB [Arcanobacterium hippocoleae]
MNITENQTQEMQVNSVAESQPVVRRRTVGVRTVKMTVSRIDPFSAIKICFLVSVAIGIMIVVAATVLWFVLDAMYVWSSINDFLVTLKNSAMLQLAQFLEFGRMIPFVVVVAVLQVIMFTLLGGIFALVFNVVAMLVGGFKITVTDE